MDDLSKTAAVENSVRADFLISKKLIKVTEILKDLHFDFPLNGIAILMEVSCEDGVSSSDISHRLGLPKATTSRNLRMLSDRLSHEKEGLRLIELRHDEKDYRVRRAYMTLKGYKVVQRINEAMA
ncbi:helix-turn-helix domain-containing protein [Corallincola spongiicola]|uniref:MarR family transcriptional regulator n=1 Tax=Corallincola spongiicola TaxID=2520508 RepID=A0ABY1WT95_9GAMM|nr:MarR family transcriptional regulator [Corallincola spongiicola]TAA47959.1 MarR family transcriptional regulator [Corallincola spongiicola]